MLPKSPNQEFRVPRFFLTTWYPPGLHCLVGRRMGHHGFHCQGHVRGKGLTEGARFMFRASGLGRWRLEFPYKAPREPSGKSSDGHSHESVEAEWWGGRDGSQTLNMRVYFMWKSVFGGGARDICEPRGSVLFCSTLMFSTVAAPPIIFVMSPYSHKQNPSGGDCQCRQTSGFPYYPRFPPE